MKPNSQPVWTIFTLLLGPALFLGQGSCKRWVWEGEDSVSDARPDSPGVIGPVPFSPSTRPVVGLMDDASPAPTVPSSPSSGLAKGPTLLPDSPADAAIGPLVTPSAPSPTRPRGAGCPAGMVGIESFCIDQYEAYVVVLDHTGREHFHSPYERPDGKRIRAKVRPGAVPQGYISQLASAKACKEAGKRLCEKEEFLRACKGPNPDENLYPYGGRKKLRGYCNEGKGSGVVKKYGNDVSTWTIDMFNDPELNKEPDTLARGGQYKRCVSPDGVFDLVGNLHEWAADPPDAKGRGRFRGGFYGDAEVNGHGCEYVTKAHELSYHDYSTGFRCCATRREGEANP